MQRDAFSTGPPGSDLEACFERIDSTDVASAVFASASTPQPSPSIVPLPLLHFWREAVRLLRRHKKRERVSLLIFNPAALNVELGAFCMNLHASYKFMYCVNTLYMFLYENVPQ
jgi:hypothetical protein